MKKIIVTIIVLLVSFSCFAQDTEAPTAPTDLFAVFYQNTNGNVTLVWDSSTDNVDVIEYDVYVNNVNYQTVQHIPNQSQQDVPLTNLFNNSYCFYIVAKDAALNVSNPSSTICIYRYPGDPSDQYPDEVYLSAIANGTGANKVLEISNYTGAPADLSEYSLRISRDGSSTWQDTFTFPINSILPDAEAYVIGNSLGTYCDTEYDTTDDVITDFDGNDVIGLFRGTILLDTFGNLGENATFVSNNQAKYRGTSGNNSSNMYEDAIWEPATMTSTCDGRMGSAEFVLLSTEEFETNTFLIYPNPVTENKLHFNTKNNQTVDAVIIFDINGRNILTSTMILNNQLDIQNIKPGVYFVKIQSENKISTHKLIRQ